MAKLRFKLSQRHPKSKDRKLHGKKSESRSQQQQQQEQELQNGLPRMPYIRCGFLQGKTPKVLPSTDDQHSTSTTKLPQSPVNRKAADISFPSSRGPSVPVTPVPKKWLTLGCDPCKQHRSLLQEDYKLRPLPVPAAGTDHHLQHFGDDGNRPKVRTSARKASSPSSSSSASPPVTCSTAAEVSRVCALQKRDDWQQEMCWKVVARSQNDVVRKQVVLQRKSSSVFKPTREHHQDAGLITHSLRSVDDYDAGAVARTGASEGSVSARNSCDSRLGNLKSGSEIAVYKLMTTSPDQSMENDSFYAWDKDLSPFASESSIFTSFDSPNDISKSNGTGKIYASPESRKTRYNLSMLKPVSPGKEERRRSPESQLKKEESSWSASPPLAPAHFDDYQVPLKSHEDPEAISKSWDGFRPCPSPLNIEEDVVPPTGHHQMENSQQQETGYLSIEEHESKHVKHKQKDRKRKQKRQAFTSRVMESFAVERTSVNPYRDFRESMIEMILKKDLFQYKDLEELLRSYLILNKVEFHDLIVQVFTDLWYQLFSYDSS